MDSGRIAADRERSGQWKTSCARALAPAAASSGRVRLRIPAVTPRNGRPPLSGLQRVGLRGCLHLLLRYRVRVLRFPNSASPLALEIRPDAKHQAGAADIVAGLAGEAGGTAD